ncbi:BrnT family toxin [Arabiibacter massiliensis]|uniref:BrnT family toxin n=1 Tax=Arabiibacter massiliensis TaxID=1870985 RepID=UPI0009BA8C5D|nr:BrnT family toxin [Arabiibacter massiliensis]
MNTHDIPLPIFFFDYRKNEANIEKHGVSFEEAKGIWLDPDYLKVPAKKSGEKRFLAIGMVDGRCLTAVATNRGNAVRIISARRASKKEAKQYGHRDR